MSAWLFTELSNMGYPVLNMEAYQAAEFLKAQRNKTDRNDLAAWLDGAHGGEFIKPVIVRSQSSQATRALLTMRNFW